jgi:hypothetical protein
MPNRARAAASRRWGRRVLARLSAVLAVGMLFALVMSQQWRTTSQELSEVSAERHGVAYLQPLVQFVAELTDAQAAAVRFGQPSANRVEAAINAVSSADDSHGDVLGTHQRWAELRGRTATLLAQRVSGAQAYAAYSDLMTLALDLARQVGDASKLILDPALDSYYLTDAALVRIPDVLVGAARAADLAALADLQPSEAAQTRVAVARYQVAVASDAMGAGLRKAIGVTRSVTLGPNVIGRFDTFRSTVDTFVPPATLLQTFDRADGATLVGSAERVRQQARSLADTVLGELDALLRDRHHSLSTQRTWEITGVCAGGFLGIVLLALLLPAAPRPRPAEAEPAEVSDEDPADADTTFVDPRDLTAVQELLHVGRAVRTRPRERVDNAG